MCTASPVSTRASACGTGGGELTPCRPSPETQPCLRVTDLLLMQRCHHLEQEKGAARSRERARAFAVHPPSGMSAPKKPRTCSVFVPVMNDRVKERCPAAVWSLCFLSACSLVSPFGRSFVCFCLFVRPGAGPPGPAATVEGPVGPACGRAHAHQTASNRMVSG